MKFTSAAASLAIAALVACHGAAATTATASTSTSTSTATLSAQEALQAVKSIDLPAGVTLSGTVEPISAPPTSATATATAAAEKTTEAAVVGHDAHGGDDHREYFGAGGLWGGAGIGTGIGGPWWGRYGPYRFGFSCGRLGLGGWAYPLGYWNAYGAGIYGGGCGLGIPFGGLFYC